MECWLQSNRRAAWPAAVAPAVTHFAALGGLFFLLGSDWSPWVVWPLAGVAGIVAFLSLATVVAMVLWARLPRLAFDGERLLVFMTGLEPIAVPIDVVEVFFRGQSGAGLPGKDGGEAKTAAITVRLAEAATEWQAREVRPSLGKWADSYIVISGTWCEPITPDLLKQLNARLVAVHRQRRGGAAVEAPFGGGECCGGSGAGHGDCDGSKSPAEPASSHAFCEHHSHSNTCEHHRHDPPAGQCS